MNLRPLSNSDLMLGPPHHLGVPQPWTFQLREPKTLDGTVDGLYPQPGNHRSCIDVEPVTGRALRAYQRTQWSYKVDRDAMYPLFVFGTLCEHRVARCAAPGSDPLEWAHSTYLPMFWRQESYVITPDKAWELQQGVLSELTRAQALSTQGLIAGGSVLVLGIVCLWFTLGRRCCGCCFGTDEAKIHKLD